MTKSLRLLTGTVCALLPGRLRNPLTASRSGGTPFGVTSDGQPVNVYTIRNAKGCEARVMNFGGIVLSLTMPDKNGKLGDVVLGHDVFAPYQTNSPYFGALIGRYGNRVAKGKFTLDGQTYTLAQNNGGNNLHGGPNGFDKVIWNVKPIKTKAGPALELTYLSKDGDQGFPGNLNVTAVYTLTEDNSLRVDFTATTDKTNRLQSHTSFLLQSCRQRRCFKSRSPNLCR